MLIGAELLAVERIGPCGHGLGLECLRLKRGGHFRGDHAGKIGVHRERFDGFAVQKNHRGVGIPAGQRRRVRFRNGHIGLGGIRLCLLRFGRRWLLDGCCLHRRQGVVAGAEHRIDKGENRDGGGLKKKGFHYMHALPFC